MVSNPEVEPCAAEAQEPGKELEVVEVAAVAAVVGEVAVAVEEGGWCSLG